MPSIRPIPMIERTVRREGLPHWLPWLILLLALGVGGVSLRYVLPGMPSAAPLDNLALRPSTLALHAASASVALMLGAAQFLLPRRGRGLIAHRWTGRGYVAAVLLGGGSALVLAPDTTTGSVAALGFGLLAVLWLTATAIALVAILSGDVIRHRHWMTRSYALAAAAITLRIYLPLANMAEIPFPISYPVIAWLCWVPNLLLTEFWLWNRRPAAGPAAAPA